MGLAIWLQDDNEVSRRVFIRAGCLRELSEGRIPLSLTSMGVAALEYDSQTEVRPPYAGVTTYRVSIPRQNDSPVLKDASTMSHRE